MHKSFLALVIVAALVGLGSSRRAMLLSKKPDNSIRYLIKQGFEGTGYDNSETWVAVTGVADPDDATWPAAGSQNLALRRSAATVTVERSWPDLGGGTNLNIVSFFGAFVFESTNLNATFMTGVSNGVQSGIVHIRAGGRLRLYNPNGTTFASPADPVNTNTLVYIWGDWDNTVGSVTLEWATTTTKVGSGTKYATTSGGATGGTIHGIQLTGAGAGITNYFDYLRVHTNALPSSPE